MRNQIVYEPDFSHNPLDNILITDQEQATRLLLLLLHSINNICQEYPQLHAAQQETQQQQ